jgi:hypothetical protein
MGIRGNDTHMSSTDERHVRRYVLLTTSRRSSWAFLAGKKKFDPEKSYETFYRENVPEKPLQTHHDKLTSIISDSSVTTMGIFP